MVENPEAHLHPSAQAAMGEFLAISAASGIQVILETHSDHVLNGIRRAVKKGLITHHDVAIHFFTGEVPVGSTRNFDAGAFVFAVVSFSIPPALPL